MSEDAVTSDTLIEACTAGDLATIQALLQQPPYIAKTLSIEERVTFAELQITQHILNLLTMFNAAAEAGSAPLVKYLLSFAHTHGISHETLIRRDSIGPAIGTDDSVGVFKEMHAVYPEFVNMDMGHLGTVLSQAVNGTRNCPRYTADRAPLVRFLLERGADPNGRRGSDSSVPGSILRAAVERSTLEVIEMLLEHGAQIAQSGAMHAAAEEGRIDVLEVLLRRGGDVNEQLWTNLEFYESRRTKRKKEQGIVGEGEERWSHETPLHYSVFGRQREATAWLVRKGADAAIVDSRGWSAWGMAGIMGDEGVLGALASEVEEGYRGSWNPFDEAGTYGK